MIRPSSQLFVDHNVFVTVTDIVSGSVRVITAKNLVVDNHLNLVRDSLATLNSFISAPYTLAIGTGTTAPTVADTALEAQVISRVIDRRSVANKQVTFEVLFDTTEANGNTITEEGMFSVNGVLCARALIQPAVVKTSAIQLTIKHVINLSRPPT